MLQAELDRFFRTRDRARLGAASVEPLDEHGFVLRPDGAPGPGGDGRDIDLVVLALVHGDEYGGLPVINALCRLIETGALTPGLTIAFVLGNVPAAHAGRRFLERDLNRSFARTDTETAEDRRARQIEPVLRRTRFVVDLHQTIEPCHTPFFIFAFTEANLGFCQSISTTLPAVTHKGATYWETTKGLTLFEYVVHVGAIGTAVELGQKGFGFYDESAGLAVTTGAIATLRGLADGAAPPAPSDDANPLYTWQAIVPYPEGEVALEEGLVNFQPIRQGQRLGRVDGAPIEAPSDGALLFPKYARTPGEPKPSELYRLMRRIPLAELTAGDDPAAANG